MKCLSGFSVVICKLFPSVLKICVWKRKHVYTQILCTWLNEVFGTLLFFCPGDDMMALSWYLKSLSILFQTTSKFQAVQRAATWTFKLPERKLFISPYTSRGNNLTDWEILTTWKLFSGELLKKSGIFFSFFLLLWVVTMTSETVFKLVLYVALSAWGRRSRQKEISCRSVNFYLSSLKKCACEVLCEALRRFLSDFSAIKLIRLSLNCSEAKSFNNGLRLMCWLQAVMKWKRVEEVIDIYELKSWGGSLLAL